MAKFIILVYFFISQLNGTRVEVNLSIFNLDVRIVVVYITFVFVSIWIYNNNWPIFDYTMYVPSNYSKSTIDFGIRNG